MIREDLLKLLARDRNTAGYSWLGQYWFEEALLGLITSSFYLCRKFREWHFHKLHVFRGTVNHGELKKKESTKNTNIRESHNSRYKNNEYLCIEWYF